jgi:hypothetical protein
MCKLVPLPPRGFELLVNELQALPAELPQISARFRLRNGRRNFGCTGNTPVPSQNGPCVVEFRKVPVLTPMSATSRSL